MKYPDDRFSSFKRIEGLTKPIKNIAQNDKKTLWAVDSYKGLYRIDFDEQNNSKKITNVTQQNGLKDDYNVKLFQFRNEIIFYVDNTWYKNNPITNKLEVYPIFNNNFKNITDITTIDDNNFLIVKEGLFYIINIKESDFIWNLIPKKYYEGKNLSDDTKVVKQANNLIFNLDDGFFSYIPQSDSIENYNVKIEGYHDNLLVTNESEIKHNQSIELQVISPYYGFKKKNLFYPIIWLEWFGKNLATFRGGFVNLSRYLYSVSIISSHNCINGLCNIGYSRMAHDNLPSILRCRGDFLRFCHGTNVIVNHEKSYGLRSIYSYKAC